MPSQIGAGPGAAGLADTGPGRPIPTTIAAATMEQNLVRMNHLLERTEWRPIHITGSRIPFADASSQRSAPRPRMALR